jgi:hypothetical protein
MLLAVSSGVMGFKTARTIILAPPKSQEIVGVPSLDKKGTSYYPASSQPDCLLPTLETCMSDAPEIPDAKSGFEKKIAVSIAILAVFLSFIENKGDNAKTDSILLTTEASNQWSYFQSKSVKEHIAQSSINIMTVADKSVAGSRTILKLEENVARYAKEKDEIKAKAESLQNEAEHNGGINDRCDLASLLIQIAIIFSSIAILAEIRWFWFGGILLGAAGCVAGVTAFLM